MAELLLRWEKFGLSRGLHDMLGAGELVDVTLACQGEILQAHKTVLAACSPHFKHIFVVNPSQHPVVIMQDVRLPHLKALLNFMYTGEATVAQQDLACFLRTAEALRVSGLAAGNEQMDPEENETDVAQTTGLNIEASEQPPAAIPPLPRKKPRHSRSDSDWSAASSPLRLFSKALAVPALDLPPVKLEFEEELRGEEEWLSLNQIEQNQDFRTTPVPRGQSVCEDQSINQEGRFIVAEQQQGERWFGAGPSSSCSQQPAGTSTTNSQANKQRQLSTHKEMDAVSNSSKSALATPNESNQQLYKCRFCEKSFSRRDTINFHVRCAHGNSELSQPSTCDGCKKTFKNKRSLLEHIRVFHSGKNNIYHLCHLCKKSYSNKSNLNLHLRTKHKGEKY